MHKLESEKMSQHDNTEDVTKVHIVGVEGDDESQKDESEVEAKEDSGFLDETETSQTTESDKKSG